MGSYWANYTRVGTVILVLMDFCDIWLPVSSNHAVDVILPSILHADTAIIAYVMSSVARHAARQALSIPPTPDDDRPHLCRLSHLVVDHPSDRFLARHALVHFPRPAHLALGLAPGKGSIRQRMGHQRFPGPVDRLVDHELYLVLDGVQRRMEGRHGARSRGYSE